MLGRPKVKASTSPAARERAMRAVPHQAPTLRREEKEKKLYVTVQFQRVRWQRLLGAERLCERTFGLDRYGRFVYESCNGKRSVRAIIKGFAKEMRVSVSEAEMAVTKFMQTLLSKGVIVMEMEK
jgi:hypothetical protein